MPSKLVTSGKQRLANLAPSRSRDVTVRAEAHEINNRDETLVYVRVHVDQMVIKSVFDDTGALLFHTAHPEGAPENSAEQFFDRWYGNRTRTPSFHHSSNPVEDR